MKLFFLIIILSFLIFTSCRVGVTLPYNYLYTLTNPEEIVIDSLANQKYINKYSSSEYKKNFETHLRNYLNNYNLAYTNNLKSNININIIDFKVYELSTYETVSDETSPDYGTSYSVNSCYVSYKFSIEFNEENIGEWKVYESKSEEITNRRSFFDYLFGTNKDNSSYRHKDLAQDVFDKIIENAAKSGAAKISRKVKKKL